jgi:phosphoribosylanthranilate isomerase
MESDNKSLIFIPFIKEFLPLKQALVIRGSLRMQRLAACISDRAVNKLSHASIMEFFSGKKPSLKICGVTLEKDARQLAELGVDAVGFNFWTGSKRFLDPADGLWSKDLAGRILRVGVFVNEASDLPFRLIADDMIDVVQLHGDETPEQVMRFKDAGIPVIKAHGVKDAADIDRAGMFDADAILLDAHAPKVFGGTGETFDWGLAQEFKRRFPERCLLLAGGITSENIDSAITEVCPAALDVASGAEHAPGVKDFEKVRLLLEACRKES